jgi:hypothetical protein
MNEVDAETILKFALANLADDRTGQPQRPDA